MREREPVTAATMREQFEAVQRQLYQAQRMSSLGTLMSSITHEYNNILTTIINYARLGLNKPDDAMRQKALEKILAASQRAARITNGLLGLARNRPDDRILVDLSNLAGEILGLVEKDMVKARVRVQAELQPAWARINPTQIQQVLLNLVINSRQAMPDGGTLGVRVGLSPSGRIAQIVVSDTGLGIPANRLRRIFEPFYTTKAGPDATGQGGTGLGLSVCRDIIAAHRGKIRVESIPGQGTTFTIKLPVGPADEKPRIADRG